MITARRECGIEVSDRSRGRRRGERIRRKHRVDAHHASALRRKLHGGLLLSVANVELDRRDGMLDGMTELSRGADGVGDLLRRVREVHVRPPRRARAALPIAGARVEARPLAIVAHEAVLDRIGERVDDLVEDGVGREQQSCGERLSVGPHGIEAAPVAKKLNHGRNAWWTTSWLKQRAKKALISATAKTFWRASISRRRRLSITTLQLAALWCRRRRDFGSRFHVL